MAQCHLNRTRTRWEYNCLSAENELKWCQRCQHLPSETHRHFSNCLSHLIRRVWWRNIQSSLQSLRWNSSWLATQKDLERLGKTVGKAVAQDAEKRSVCSLISQVVLMLSPLLQKSNYTCLIGQLDIGGVSLSWLSNFIANNSMLRVLDDRVREWMLC